MRISQSNVINEDESEMYYSLFSYFEIGFVEADTHQYFHNLD